MQPDIRAFDPKAIARLAGALYLSIIVLGIWSEVFVRAPLIVPADPAGTAANIAGAERLFRFSIAADSVMAMADIGLAVLLFFLLRPVNFILALAAMIFRLIQAAIIGMNLLNQDAALLALNSGATLSGFDAAQVSGLATFSMIAHGDGYDIGLLFFGVNSVLTGLLLVLSGYFPKLLGILLGLAGVVYLIGGYLVLLAPGLSSAFAPAYGLTILAESAFCLWLLIRGIDGHGFARAAARQVVA